jgi:hypothetical protein
VRKRALRFVSTCAVAGGLASGGLLLATTTAASAHFTCNDGSTTPIDDPAVACVGHDGIAHEGIGGGPTTEAPDHDHDAPVTTARRPAPTTRSATPSTKKAPASVKVTPKFTG